MPPTRAQVRVQTNRKAFTAIELGIADGLFTVGKNILLRARPPSDVGEETPSMVAEEKTERRPPLIKNGGVIAYIDRRKVASFGLDGKEPKKPRGGNARLAAHGWLRVVAFVGFGFPGRFVELGTIKMPARPFLTPAAGEELPGAIPIIRRRVQFLLERMAKSRG